MSRVVINSIKRKEVNMGMAEDLPPSNGTRIGHFSFVTEGLKQCVEQGWITDEEAQKEVRAMLPLVSAQDKQLKRAKELRKQADEIEQEFDSD